MFPDSFIGRHSDVKTNVQGIKLRHKETVRYLPHYQVGRKEGGQNQAGWIRGQLRAF